MNRGSLVYKTVLGVVLVMIILLGSLVDARAQECRIIRITGMLTDNSITVEPARMEISKGDCAVWFNRAGDANMKVIFEDGKTCAAATEASELFLMDVPGQCFVTSWVPAWGTSSLRFMEKGTYRYTIEMASGGPEALTEKGQKVTEGEIIVSE